MSYIALRHSGIITTISVAHLDKVNEILAKATPDDTVHKVPDSVCTDTNTLLKYIADQLSTGEFVTV